MVDSRFTGLITVAFSSAVVAPVMAATPAFTGIAAGADTAETAITNPAGMSRLDGPRTTLRLMLATGLGEFKVDNDMTTTTGGNPDSSIDPLFIPMGYYVRPIGERWHAGISLTVPNGFGADYGGTWAGRYYSDYYSLVYLAVTPAVSYRVNEQLSLGLAVGVNYTLSESKVALNTLGSEDGRLETKLDGVGTSVSVSMLWEMNARTRFGLVYTSDSQADLEGDLDVKNAGPIVEKILADRGLLHTNLKVENVLPQRLVAGLYRELDTGAYVTLDTLWMDFSEFGTESVSFTGTTVDVDESGAFQDVWAVSLGYGFPQRNGRRYSAGIFYVSSPTDDDHRSLALALDRMWGMGVGLDIERANGHVIDMNFNVLDYGEGPVDTGPSTARGRVVGKTDRPYAVAFDVAYHF